MHRVSILNCNSPDDVNRNFIGTISTFKGITAPLSTKQYLDGLGRPIEVVKESYTPPTANHTAYWHQKNYVTYDALGRQSKSYLPFETGTLGFENAPIYLNAAGYVETRYEESPLSRPISQRSADDKFTYMGYASNIATDAVQIMIPVTTPLPVGVLVSASSPNVYGANTLYKTTMTDENGKQTCVFKDKLGRVILTRKFLNGASGANVDTYNVYDDYGQLVVVVPPGALIISNTTATVVNDLTFQYKYDNKNRLIVKKIPGAKPQKFYYDNRDLLVLTQDGNMYAENTIKHLATLYDDLGRVIKTGFTNIYLTEGTEVMIYDNNIADKLTETQYYPNKSWVKHQGAKVLNSTNLTMPTNFLWSYTERRVGLEYTGNPVWQGKQHLRYPSVSQVPITDNDTYGVDWVVSGYNGMQQPDLTIRYLFEGGAGEVRTWQNFTYDNARRLTDIKYNYGTGGAGISSPTSSPSLSNMNYNFKDQLIEKNIGYTGTGALQSIDYMYNIRGWLTNINNVALNNGSTMSIMTPNMTGSGTIQNLAITPFINRALAEAVKPYRAANANELPPIGDNNSDLFSQNIAYSDPATQTGATPQYNGNISSTTWQVLGRAKQAYGYKYDGLDRLTEAKYFDITEQYYAPYTSIYNTVDKKYDETITYDLRGNITSLKRNGLNTGTWTSDGYTAATYGMIDNLVYNYKPAPTPYDLTTVTDNTVGNKLFNVKDMSLSDKGFKYIGSAVTTYTYDDNGNLTADANKKITKITYNYLNLPSVIDFVISAVYSGKIEFVYDATGAKLKKIVTEVRENVSLDERILVTTYDYINGVEYKAGVLQRFAHTEGSVVRQPSGAYIHEYTLRDHLGNTRVTFTDADNNGFVDASDIKQINHYYPFGLNMEGNWQGGAQGDNKYQYNDKELNDDFGFGLNDYGARWYDPALGRWAMADPLADLRSNLSPYQYVRNSPINFIDPTGMLDETPGKGADGMTNEQWLNASRGGGNPELMKAYKNGNRENELEAWRAMSANGQKRAIKPSDIAASYGLQPYGTRLEDLKGNVYGVPTIDGYNLVECDRQCLISKGRQFVQVLAVGLLAYGGKQEIEAGYAAGLLGNIPLAAYLISDGVVRIGSSPLKIYGILTGKKEIINSPYNLLGLIGYIIDRYGGSPFQTGNPSGGPYQTAGELMGDYGLSRYNLLSNVDKYVSEPTLLKLGIIINSITLPARQVIQRYFEGRLPKP